MDPEEGEFINLIFTSLNMRTLYNLRRGAGINLILTSRNLLDKINKLKSDYSTNIERIIELETELSKKIEEEARFALENSENFEKRKWMTFAIPTVDLLTLWRIVGSTSSISTLNYIRRLKTNLTISRAA